MVSTRTYVSLSAGMVVIAMLMIGFGTAGSPGDHRVVGAATLGDDAGDETNETDDDHEVDGDDETNETDDDHEVDEDDEGNETDDDHEVDGGEPIDACTTITDPGEYELVADVEDSDADRCIEIVVEDVALDGNNHTIDGVDGPGTAGVVVDAVPLSNVIVRNLTTTDWGRGVQLIEGESTVRNVTAASNRDGFETRTMDTTFTEVTARNNSVAGIRGADAASDLTVRDSRVANNGVDGLVFQRTGSVRLRGTVVEGNDDDGVDAFEIAPSAFDDTVVRDNGDVGILAISDDLSIDETTVSGNGNEGIVVRDSSTPSLRENEVRDNGAGGISMLNVTDASVQNTTACGNDGTEFDYEDTTFDDVGDNTFDC